MQISIDSNHAQKHAAETLRIEEMTNSYCFECIRRLHCVITVE